MKKTNNFLLSSLSLKQIKELTSIVRESLLTDSTMPVVKKFTSAELWNIQRNKRVFSQRRFSL